MPEKEETVWNRLVNTDGSAISKPYGLYHDMIVGIVAALEAKDHPTASHSLRVSDMAETVCQILGLTSEQTEIIHMAAHVHDIGKIGIPDSILAKSGKLTQAEWNLVKEHPRIGADILSKFPGLSEVAVIILHHHERWDGKGYPDGLKEEQIPFGSRIIAVCDSIDAMMSYRPYHPFLDSLECASEIERNSGIMYDPKAAEAVLQNWDKVIKRIAGKNQNINGAKG